MGKTLTIKNAPIALFAFNRPKHLKETIEALKFNPLASESELFVFVDGPRFESEKPVATQVRKIVSTITGFKSLVIIESKKNKGLANSIISGVTELIDKYGNVIVLEDDLISNPDFLTYMNLCLETFYERDDIFSISGYSPPGVVPPGYQEDVYLSYRINSWGWATWKNRWEKVDWNVEDFNDFIKDKRQRKLFDRGGRDSSIMLLKYKKKIINSWAIRFYYSCYKNKSYCVYPSKSLIQNIGTDGSGTHLRKTNKYYTEVGMLNLSDINSFKKNAYIQPNKIILRNFFLFFKPSIIRRLINFFFLWFNLLKLKRTKSGK